MPIGNSRNFGRRRFISFNAKSPRQTSTWLAIATVILGSIPESVLSGWTSGLNGHLLQYVGLAILAARMFTFGGKSNEDKSEVDESESA